MARTIEERYRQILLEQLGPDDVAVTPDCTLGNGLGADSLDYVEIVMACEEEFGIEITDEDADAHLNGPMREWVAYLERKCAAKVARG